MREKVSKYYKPWRVEYGILWLPYHSLIQDLMAIVELACQVCGKTSDDSNMLICDGCEAGYHTYCHTPPVKNVPEGDWFCFK